VYGTRLEIYLTVKSTGEREREYCKMFIKAKNRKMVHYCVHKSLSFGPILSQFNLVYIIQPTFQSCVYLELIKAIITHWGHAVA
jgi:hypothetical protein